MNKRFYLKGVVALFCSMALVACDDDDDDDVSSDESVSTEEEVSSFFFSATNSEGTANYIASVESLTEGSSTVVGNGLETTTGTEWFTWQDRYLFRLQYNQGNSGGTSAYFLNTSGEIEARAITYDIQRFSTIGMFGDYVITAAVAASSTTDESGNAAYGITSTYIDPVGETTTNGSVIMAEDYLGTGEYVVFAGILEANDHLYTAVIPVGVSAYGYTTTGGAAVLSGNEDLVSSNAISGTQYPNECYVAIFDNKEFSNPTLVKTDQMSYACGRMKSQYYQTIWSDDDDNVYVFSPAYARTASDARLQTTYGSRVMRICKGETEFDSSYGAVDLEEMTGGLPLYRCWSMCDDYFLMQLYGSGINSSGTGANVLAIYRGSTKTVTTVTGLPSTDVLSSFCKRPYNGEDGKTYVTVQCSDGSTPAVYAIDPSTGVATKGLEVTCGEIKYAGKLIAQEE